MNETANGASPRNAGQSLFGRAESLLGSISVRLKDAQANLQGKPATATEASFSDVMHDTAAQAEAKARPATERAEVALDKAGERLGVFATTLSHRVRKAAALAREEAEDILAEAQSLRRDGSV